MKSWCHSGSVIICLNACPLSQDGVNRVADEVQIGQDVQVRVLSNAGKLNLSMKPMRISAPGLDTRVTPVFCCVDASKAVALVSRTG